MWNWLATFLSGPIIQGVIAGYKARLDAGNNSERIAADLAGRELAVEQRERELNTQIVLAEEGRWWTALPRAMVCYAYAIYICKLLVYDKVLGLGSTDALAGDVALWGGWLMALWFGGRSLEKIARIIKR